MLRSEGLSYEETAEILGLSETSIGTLLRRAQDAFRKEYVKRYGQPNYNKDNGGWRSESRDYRLRRDGSRMPIRRSTGSCIKESPHRCHAVFGFRWPARRLLLSVSSWRCCHGRCSGRRKQRRSPPRHKESTAPLKHLPKLRRPPRPRSRRWRPPLHRAMAGSRSLKRLHRRQLRRRQKRHHKSNGQRSCLAFSPRRRNKQEATSGKTERRCSVGNARRTA